MVLAPTEPIRTIPLSPRETVGGGPSQRADGVALVAAARGIPPDEETGRLPDVDDATWEAPLPVREGRPRVSAEAIDLGGIPPGRIPLDETACPCIGADLGA